MLRTLGADLVGMSTVHETIAARAAGAEVLGVSLVTNLAAGMTGQPLSHDEVLEAGRQSATRMGSLLGLGDRPALIGRTARVSATTAAGHQRRGEQHQQHPHHLRGDDERDVRAGLDGGGQHGVDAAGAGGQVALERADPGDVGQQHAEAGGGDDRARRSGRARRAAPARSRACDSRVNATPGLPADHHVAELNQDASARTDRTTVRSAAARSSAPSDRAGRRRAAGPVARRRADRRR